MKKILFFYVGDQTYGMDISATQGIEKYMNFLPVPNTLPHIKGLIHLRGNVIPVYSLRNKFGLDPKINEETAQLIIVKLREGILVAFEADAIREIREINESQETSAPVMLKSDETNYISSVFTSSDLLAIIIDTEGILTKEEKENIQNFIEEASRKKNGVKAEKKKEEDKEAEEEASEE